MGKLARERAKLLAGRLIADTQVVLSPPRIKSTLGGGFTRWVCALEELLWLSHLFIRCRIVSLAAEMLLAWKWKYWFGAFEKTQPLLNRYYLLLLSPPLPPDHHGFHHTTSPLRTCIPLRFFRFPPGSICLKVTAHSQRSQSTWSPKLCLFQLLSGLQSLYSNPKNTTTSPRLRLEYWHFRSRISLLHLSCF